MSSKKETKKRGYGNDQKRRNITLDDVRAEKLEEIGGGNLSEGIRIVTDKYNKKK